MAVRLRIAGPVPGLTGMRLIAPAARDAATSPLPRAARMSEPTLSSFLWSVADLLRGDYKQSEYGKVILPFTVLRRLDCVLEASITPGENWAAAWLPG